MQGRLRGDNAGSAGGYDKQATLKKYASFRGGIRYKGVLSYCFSSNPASRVHSEGSKLVDAVEDRPQP